MSRPIKRKRTDLALADKVKVVQMLGENKSQTEIAANLGISQSQVSRIAKNQQQILIKWQTNDNPNRKRQRTGKDADVEAALKTWFTSSRGRDVPLSGPLLQEKAKDLAKTMNKPDFKPTSGWFCRWKERNAIVYKRVHGEKKDADEPAAERWITDVLPELIRNYKPEDIYNCDETGIYYRAMPEGTLAQKSESVSGSKKAKDRITALVCTNMSGTDKRKLLVLGKSKSPRCFRGSPPLSVVYDGNANAWMTSEIFRNWLIAFEKDMKRQGRKVIVIADNCAAHPADADANLQHVKLVFLPPNTTSCIQPCDMGIIRNLKCHYRRRVISRIVSEIDSSETQMTANSLAKVITIADAIHMLHQAWLDIKQQTIVNCFKKAGFVPADDNSDCDSDGTDAYDLDDIYDIQPPDALTTEEFEEFVAVDATAPCHGMPTDEEICASVSTTNEEQPVDESADTDSDNDEVAQPPSSAQAMAALKTLRQWMEMGKCTDFSAYYKMENTVQSLVAGARRQKKIRDYFSFTDEKH